jgi:hypothetical protein
MDFIYNIIENINITNPIIAIIGLVLYLYKKPKFIIADYIFTFLLLGLIIDLISRYLAHVYNNNLICINIFNLIELTLMFLIIQKISIKLSKTYTYIAILLLIFNLYELFTANFSNPLLYQSYSKSINSLFLLLLALIQLYKSIKDDNNVKNRISLIVLTIFLTLNSFLNLPINFLINYNNYVIFFIWLINTLNANFLYSYFVYLIWKDGKTQM